MKTNGHSNGFGGKNGSGSGGQFHEPAYFSQQEEELSLQDILERIYRRKTVVIAVFALVLVATVLYTFSRRPTYQASNEVLIQKNKNASGSSLFALNDLIEPFESDERRITDELEILKTNDLRTRVAQELRDSVAINENGNLDTLQIVRASIADIRRGIYPFAPVDEIAARLIGAVSFSNERNSDIISISVKSHSPYEAAFIANAYAYQYYNLNLSSSRDMATSVREFLQGQLADTRTSLDTAEARLQNFMQANKIVSLGDETTNLIAEMSTFDAQKDDVVIQMRAAQNVLDVYESRLAKIQPSVASSVSSAIDPYIVLLQQQIAQLEVQKDVAQSQNPIVADKQVYNEIYAKIDSQIADLRSKLDSKTNQLIRSQILSTGMAGGSQSPGQGGYDPTGYYKELRLQILRQQIQLSGLKAQKAELDSIVDRYGTQFSKIPKEYIELAKLQRTETSAEKLFLMIQDNFEHAQISEQSQFGYVQIIDPAVPPSVPVSPKIPLNLTLGILIGLALGIGNVFMLDYMDRSIKSPEDLEKKGLTVLASIPVISGAEEHKGRTDGNAVKEGVAASLRLVTFLKPSDPISEAYRSLRTAILYSRIDKPLKTLMVASALPKEGKSTTVGNVGIIFAKAGMKTLIVDADFRRPLQHRLFNIDRKPGLVECLRGEITLNDVVKERFVENLFLMPAGSLPPNPSEALGSDSMKAFIEVAKAAFDFIIFDSPPIVAVTDGVVLSNLTDGVIFVAQANKTELDVLEKAYSTLRQVKANVIGFLLNEFDVTKAYGAYYRYYRYYHHYGYKEETRRSAERGT